MWDPQEAGASSAANSAGRTKASVFRLGLVDYRGEGIGDVADHDHSVDVGDCRRSLGDLFGELFASRPQSAKNSSTLRSPIVMISQSRADITGLSET